MHLTARFPEDLLSASVQAAAYHLEIAVRTLFLTCICTSLEPVGTSGGTNCARHRPGQPAGGTRARTSPPSSQGL